MATGASTMASRCNRLARARRWCAPTSVVATADDALAVQRQGVAGRVLSAADGTAAAGVPSKQAIGSGTTAAVRRMGPGGPRRTDPMSPRSSTACLRLVSRGASAARRIRNITRQSRLRRMPLGRQRPTRQAEPRRSVVEPKVRGAGASTSSRRGCSVVSGSGQKRPAGGPVGSGAGLIRPVLEGTGNSLTSKSESTVGHSVASVREQDSAATFDVGPVSHRRHHLGEDHGSGDRMRPAGGDEGADDTGGVGDRRHVGRRHRGHFTGRLVRAAVASCCCHAGMVKNGQTRAIPCGAPGGVEGGEDPLGTRGRGARHRWSRDCWRDRRSARSRTGLERPGHRSNRSGPAGCGPHRSRTRPCPPGR